MKFSKHSKLLVILYGTLLVVAKSIEQNFFIFLTNEMILGLNPLSKIIFMPMYFLNLCFEIQKSNSKV